MKLQWLDIGDIIKILRKLPIMHLRFPYLFGHASTLSPFQLFRWTMNIENWRTIKVIYGTRIRSKSDWNWFQPFVRAKQAGWLLIIVFVAPKWLLSFILTFNSVDRTQESDDSLYLPRRVKTTVSVMFERVDRTKNKAFLHDLSWIIKSFYNRKLLQ